MNTLEDVAANGLQHIKSTYTKLSPTSDDLMTKEGNGWESG